MIFVRFIPICFDSRIKVVYLRQTDARLNYDELEWNKDSIIRCVGTIESTVGKTIIIITKLTEK